jgi:soluble lytic murein transglycosylase
LLKAVLCFAVVCYGLAGLGPATAQPAADADRAAALAALAAAQSGDWAQAYAHAGQSHDPLALKLVRWLDYARTGTAGRFAEIADFIEHNPDWPYPKTLQRRAEEALAAESDDTAAAWFKRHPAASGPGKVREGEIKLARGDAAGGLAELRAAWVEGNFLPIDERNFLAKHGSKLRPEDNIRRADRLLWDGQRDAAQRMLPALPPEYRAVAEARLAFHGRSANRADREALMARVPAALRGDPGLVYDQIDWLRRNDENEAAAQLLLAHPDNPVKPPAWWSERQIVARRLLAVGNADLAYRLVTQHGLTEGGDFSEAEFLAGYIALRYLKQPKAAFDHFALILARVESPYGKARAAYWSGRAAEALGKHDLALKWYAAGAENQTTFYGQLSAHQLGSDAPPKPLPEPRPDEAQLARFNAEEQVRAAELFIAVGDREHARIFVTHLADIAKNVMDYAMLASFAETHGRIDLAIVVARKALAAGTPLMVHGYPIITLPPGGTVEKPLLYAIVRQESAFDQYAISRAGARGLMQLMPGTAATVARKMQLDYSAERLTGDGIYNVLLGRSYLEGLLDDFGGSYGLAIAGYNAGPGRIRQWLRDYGDPRGKDVDMVDWIETIPFTETRIYVQRVLENLQVYRGQANNTAAFSLASDLAR